MNHMNCYQVIKTTLSRMRTYIQCHQSITNENYNMTSYHERPKRRFYLVCQICRRYLVGKTTVYRRISVTHRERRRRRRVSRLKHIYLDLLEHKNSAMYFGSVSYRVVRRRASSCVVVCRSDGRRITCVMRRSTLS